MNELAMADITTPAVIIIDGKGYIAGWNEGAEKVLGFTAEQVVGRASHDVLCGHDSNGQIVCHPWCALSPGDTREDPDDDVVLYPRSAAAKVIRVTLSVFRVLGTDPTRSWVVHLITSAKPVPANPPRPRYVDPVRASRPRSPLRAITARGIKD